MPPSSSKDFKKFVEEYDEYQYKSQCSCGSQVCLKFFAKKGDLRNVRKALKKGAQNLGAALHAAAKYNQENIIDFILKNKTGHRYIDWGLEGAIDGGNVELIEFFLEKGARKYGSMYYSAAKNGSPGVLKLFEFNTPEYRNSGFIGAVRGGHFELMKKFFLENNGVCDIEEALIGAAKGGHLEIVKFLVNNGVEDLSDAYTAAVRKGQLLLIKYFLSLDGSLTLMLSEEIDIIEAGNLEVIDYFVENKLINISELVTRAATFDKLDVLKYLVAKLLDSDLSRMEIRSVLVTSIRYTVVYGYKDNLDYLFSVLPPATISENGKSVLDYALLSAVQCQFLVD